MFQLPPTIVIAESDCRTHAAAHLSLIVTYFLFQSRKYSSILCIFSKTIIFFVKTLSVSTMDRPKIVTKQKKTAQKRLTSFSLYRFKKMNFSEYRITRLSTASFSNI